MDNINTIASITTIFALFIAIAAFYDAKSQEEDYRIALTSELINEIDFNQNIIEFIQNNREELTTTFAVPMYKFSTIILEEALRNGKIGNLTTKKKGRRTSLRKSTPSRCLQLLLPILNLR